MHINDLVQFWDKLSLFIPQDLAAWKEGQQLSPTKTTVLFYIEWSSSVKEEQYTVQQCDGKLIRF